MRQKYFILRWKTILLGLVMAPVSISGMEDYTRQDIDLSEVDVNPKIVSQSKSKKAFKREQKALRKQKAVEKDIRNIENIHVDVGIEINSSYHPGFYTGLEFPGSKGKPSVRFESYELVWLVKEILKDFPSIPAQTPNYKNYKEHVDEGFKQMLHQFCRDAAKAYGFPTCSITFRGVRYESTDKFTFLMNRVFAQESIEFCPGIKCLELFSSKDLVDLWQNVMGETKNKKDRVGSIISPDYDRYILPPTILPTSSPSGWLGLAKHVAQGPDPVKGWWIHVGERLILLRHPDVKNQPLYVSDHGDINDLIHQSREKFLNFNDENQRERGRVSYKFSDVYDRLNKDQKRILRDRFIYRVSLEQELTDDQMEFILLSVLMSIDYRNYLNSGGLKECPGWAYLGNGMRFHEIEFSRNEKESVEVLIPEKKEALEKLFDKHLHTVLFLAQQYQNYYHAEIKNNLNMFFTQVDNAFPKEDANRFRIFYTLLEILKNSAEGIQEALFRPISSFGDANSGAPYREFGEAFVKCKNQDPNLDDIKIAREMRRILNGKFLENKNLYFLPNLITAWFVSETARNESSLLSGLMLLDLIEIGKKCIDSEGKNWYEWRHTCIHPSTEEDHFMDDRYKYDLYGDRIVDYWEKEDSIWESKKIDNFKQKDIKRRRHTNLYGLHPMSDGGAVNNSKYPLDNGKKLSWCRQKEGHIFSDWLYEALKGDYPKVKALKHISTEILIPDFSEIQTLYTSSNKEVSRLDKRLQRKWNILESLKEKNKRRLGHLGCMLFSEVIFE